jgi:hypothetical protein
MARYGRNEGNGKNGAKVRVIKNIINQVIVGAYENSLFIITIKLSLYN